MKSKRLILVVSLVALLAFATDGFAAAAYFLKIPGIAGESKYKNHAGEILVQRFDFNVDSSSNTTFSITKLLDTSTTDLILALSGSPTDTPATFTAEKSAGTDTKFFTMVFSNLTVVSSQISDAGSADIIPVEKVTFNFTQVVISYYTVSAKGTNIPKSVTVIKNNNY